MRKIKIKPFDLEKALEGAPVVTRDGHRVKIIDYNWKTFFGVRFNLQNKPFILTATRNGRFFYNSESSYDLFLLDEETQEGGKRYDNK